MPLSLLCGLLACGPYPDDGEFFAGIVFNGSFLSGVKSMTASVPVAARGQSAFAMFITGGSSATSVSATSPATSPLWTDAGKRDPLNPQNAQQVYVFDGARSCSPPKDQQAFDPRLDPIDLFTQYPIFADLPEVLSTNAGRAGRTGAYSAIVEVVHVTMPAGTTCQSFKRNDSMKKRLESGELSVAAGTGKEYRLLQIIDTAATIPPMPFQLGWFNQLLVPYVDMGPVPVGTDNKFQTMPLYSLVLAGAMPTVTGLVVTGVADDSPVAGVPGYSPICRDTTLSYTDAKNPPPVDASDPAYAKATAGTTLSACLICRVATDGESLVCPFAKSGGGAR